MVSYDTFSGGLFIGRVVIVQQQQKLEEETNKHLEKGGTPLPKNLGFRV
jgi:hypothetical protein